MTRLAMRTLLAWMLGLLICSAIGCGDRSAVKTYRVSGRATFGGKPIPYGHVVFAPDASRGNQGPGSVAIIKDGRYETFAGKGVVGGPYRVAISGQNAAPHVLPDDQLGELFAPYETTADLPHGNSEHDFDVPRGL